MFLINDTFLIENISLLLQISSNMKGRGGKKNKVENPENFNEEN